MQDKSWSFLFAESPVMSILRDDDDDDDDDSGEGEPRAGSRRGTTLAPSSDDSPRTPPYRARSRQTKTRSRIFTSRRSRMQTDSPLEDEAGSVSDEDLERRLGGLLRSLLDDEEANPADVQSVRSAMAVVAGRARRAHPRGTSTEANVVEENEHEHERQHATKMS